MKAGSLVTPLIDYTILERDHKLVFTPSKPIMGKEYKVRYIDGDDLYLEDITVYLPEYPSELAFAIQFWKEYEPVLSHISNSTNETETHSSTDTQTGTRIFFAPERSGSHEQKEYV